MIFGIWWSLSLLISAKSVLISAAPCFCLSAVLCLCAGSEVEFQSQLLMLSPTSIQVSVSISFWGGLLICYDCLDSCCLYYPCPVPGSNCCCHLLLSKYLYLILPGSLFILIVLIPAAHLYLYPSWIYLTCAVLSLLFNPTISVSNFFRVGLFIILIFISCCQQPAFV